MAQWVKCLPRGMGKLRLILKPAGGEEGESTPQLSPAIQTALWHEQTACPPDTRVYPHKRRISKIDIKQKISTVSQVSEMV